MLSNSDLNNVDSTATLTAKSKGPKIIASASKKSDEINLPSTSTKAAELARKLLNRGAGDCTANDILKREFPKIKTKNDNEALIVLLCEKSSQPFETRVIPLIAQTQCVIGRISSKSRACETNAYFDCKVISRNQASVWYDDDDGQFWLKDTQSANGTFVNGNKLKDEAVQLHSGDVVHFGETINENKCIVASVQLYWPKGKDSKEEVACAEKSGVEEANEEPTDSCETSRTTICEAVKVERNSKAATESRAVNNAARNVGIHFKNAQTNETIRVELLSIQSFIETIQNNQPDVLDSIAKEDNYLQRIFTLQNKIRCLKNGMTDEELQTEKHNWQNEKLSYQRTAKDAIRRFNLESKEILLKIEEVEKKFKNSEQTCDSMRDQIDSKEQAINDFLCLLRHFEIDYDEYKTEMKAKFDKVNNEFNKKVQDSKASLRKLNLERAALKRIFEQLQNLEKKSAFEPTVAVEESKAKQNLKKSLAKFQQLEQKVQLLAETKSIEEIPKLVEFKQGFVDVVEQYNSLLDGTYTLASKAEHNELKAASDEVKVADPVKPELKEACEQTIEEVNSYEVELKQLQTQIVQKSLEAEHMRDMLETECDLCRKKCLELQAERANLLAEQKEIKKRKQQAAYELALKDLKAKYTKELDQKSHTLGEVQQELNNCKTLLSENQLEAQKLENELACLAEENKKLEQKNTCLLPVLVPVLMGLVGIILYLLFGFLH